MKSLKNMSFDDFANFRQEQIAFRQEEKEKKLDIETEIKQTLVSSRNLSQKILGLKILKMLSSY